MTDSCEIVYYHHSGFTAAKADTLFVFDYWEEPGALPADKRLTAERLSEYRNVYVLTSHAHPDHMDPIVYTWEKDVPITYITAFDVPVGTRGRRMAPGDEMPLNEGVRIKAFASTDSGVSFLVELHGMNVFHAGDLNLWHWRQESSLKDIARAEKAFQEAIDPIAQERVDIALFPVDPRQGEMFDAGANRFILFVKPKILIPMHWHGRPEVAEEFTRRASGKTTDVYALTRPRERITAHMENGDLITEVYRQKEPPPAQTPSPAPYTAEGGFTEPSSDYPDPFSESDMPVDIRQADNHSGPDNSSGADG